MKLRIGGRQIDVRRTLADRVVGWLSPKAGVARLRARTQLAIASGYDGGRRDRRPTRNWRPKETSANQDTLPDLPDLRARSRELVRNMPIATGAVATVVTSVIGDGLVVRPTVDRLALGLTPEAALEWEQKARREFALFSRTADFTSVQPFAEMQALAFRAVLESGDVAVVRRFRRDPGDAFGTKLQLVEADRISNPDRMADRDGLAGGVEYNADGVTAAYHFANRHPDDYLFVTTSALAWSRFPAWDPATGRPLVLLLFDRQRPDQARGVPYLAPVIEALKKLGDYSEAEVTAAVIAAMFTAFIKTEPRDDSDPPVVGTSDAASVVDPAKEIALEDAGAIVELDPGQDVTIANPGRPNPVFDAFFTSVLRQVGVALELPYEILIKHFQASYSASRAALEMAWQFYRRRRTWLARRFCQPVYEWAIEEAVAAGRLQAPGFFDDPIRRQAWLGADWRGPSRIYLDPQKEANADQTDIDLGVKTREQVIEERTGGDLDAKTTQLGREKRLRDEAGLDSSPAQPGNTPVGASAGTAAPGAAADPDVEERREAEEA